MLVFSMDSGVAGYFAFKADLGTRPLVHVRFAPLAAFEVAVRATTWVGWSSYCDANVLRNKRMV